MTPKGNTEAMSQRVKLERERRFASFEGGFTYREPERETNSKGPLVHPSPPLPLCLSPIEQWFKCLMRKDMG